ncbi:hypothetical protein MMC18_008568 [Xylographa bjoerkii]|nr:hypothetical protein [Xylographa bjoerkii]
MALGIAGENFTSPHIRIERNKVIEETIASHTDLSSEISQEWKNSALTWLVGWVNNAHQRPLRRRSRNVRTRELDDDINNDKDTGREWRRLKSFSCFADQDIISEIQAGFTIRVYWTDLRKTVECHDTEALKEDVNYTQNLWNQLDFRKLLKALSQLFLRNVNVEEYKIVWGAAKTPVEGNIGLAAAMTEQWASGSTHAMFTIKTRLAFPMSLIPSHSSSDTKQQFNRRQSLFNEKEHLNTTSNSINANQKEKRTFHILKPPQLRQDVGLETPQHRPFMFIDLTSDSEDELLKLSNKTDRNNHTPSRRGRSPADLEDLDLQEDDEPLAQRRRVRRAIPRIKEDSDDNTHIDASRTATLVPGTPARPDVTVEDLITPIDTSDYEPSAVAQTPNTTTPTLDLHPKNQEQQRLNLRHHHLPRSQVPPPSPPPPRKRPLRSRWNTSHWSTTSVPEHDTVDRSPSHALPALSLVHSSAARY